MTQLPDGARTAEGESRRVFFEYDAFQEAVKLADHDPGVVQIAATDPELLARLIKVDGIIGLSKAERAVVHNAEYVLFTQLEALSDEGAKDVVDRVAAILEYPAPTLPGDITYDQLKVLHGMQGESPFVGMVFPLTPGAEQAF